MIVNPLSTQVTSSTGFCTVFTTLEIFDANGSTVAFTSDIRGAALRWPAYCSAYLDYETGGDAGGHVGNFALHGAVDILEAGDGADAIVEAASAGG